jgi:hypothetical protein
MQTARLRILALAASALLFAAWIGWLGWLVLHRPVVVPHAPFLVADLNVVATIKELKDQVTVKEVVWARDPQLASGLEGTDIRVTNLGRCQADWHGLGDYLVPLLKTGPDTYEVADATGLSEAARREYVDRGREPPSLSPGYDPGLDRDRKTIRPPHIYPANSETLAQLRQIHPPK